MLRFRDCAAGFRTTVRSSHSRRHSKKRAVCREEFSDLDSKDPAFLDESGVKSNMSPRYVPSVYTAHGGAMPSDCS